MIENWTKLIQPTGSESWLNETMVFCYLRNKKQTGLQVYHSCGIYELTLQLLDQWIYKQRFRKHNQVKISKKKERRFGGKWCHDVAETSLFPISNFYLLMD